MSENTPSTEDIRREWAAHRADSYALAMGAGADEVALAEWDRWLADHDAGVAARTLREAAEEYRIRAQYDATWQWLIDRAADLRGEG